MTYNYYLSKKARKELRKEQVKATVKKTLEKIGIGCYCAKTALFTFSVGVLFFATLFLFPAFFH